jgi:hypothetical protein
MGFLGSFKNTFGKETAIVPDENEEGPGQPSG